MAKGDLKRLRTAMSRVHTLIHLVNVDEESLTEFASEDEYQQIIKTLERAVSGMKEKAKTLPLGTRYSGTFYIRKPYTMPTESVQVTGSAFMREDLISWSIDESVRPDFVYGVLRDIFKDKELKEPIKREEGELVFADD